MPKEKKKVKVSIENWDMLTVIVETFDPSTQRQSRRDLCEFKVNQVYKS